MNRVTISLGENEDRSGEFLSDSRMSCRYPGGCCGRRNSEDGRADSAHHAGGEEPQGDSSGDSDAAEAFNRKAVFALDDVEHIMVDPLLSEPLERIIGLRNSNQGNTTATVML